MILLCVSRFSQVRPFVSSVNAAATVSLLPSHRTMETACDRWSCGGVNAGNEHSLNTLSIQFNSGAADWRTCARGAGPMRGSRGEARRAPEARALYKDWDSTHDDE
ncbi:hypothetical protein BS78_09G088900 [Paspalum vaginatum]|nr:hypothetical protein BS78_09G088900 [Paspalum vaginatum]